MSDEQGEEQQADFRVLEKEEAHAADCTCGPCLMDWLVEQHADWTKGYLLPPAHLGTASNRDTILDRCPDCLGTGWNAFGECRCQKR